MAYYDPNKTYGYGGIGIRNFLDAGMKKQGDTIADQQADLNTLVNNLSVDMQQKAGAITAEEAEQLRQEGAEQVEADLAANRSRVTKQSLLNMGINSAGIVLSGVSAAGIGKVSSFGKQAALTKTAAQTAKTNAQRAAGEKVTKLTLSELGKAVGGEGASNLWLRGVGANVAMSVSKNTPFNLLTKAAAVALPTVATQVYTRTKTAEEISRMQQTYNVLNSRYEYLQSEDAKLDGTMQADTAEWQEYHETGLARIEEAYRAGQLTDEQYAQAYEQFIQDSDAKWQEYADGHADTAEYVTQHGVAYAEDQYALDHGYSLDEAMKRNTTIRQDQERTPEAKEAYDAGYETAKKLDTGSSFTNFLATMNATLLHYVPGLAYVEAAVVKVGDMVADFAANKVPVLSSMISYDEKHKGDSISDIAKSICTDAEARYELAHQVSETSRTLADGAEAPAARQDAAEIAEGIADQGGYAPSPA